MQKKVQLQLTFFDVAVELFHWVCEKPMWKVLRLSSPTDKNKVCAGL